MGKSNHLGVGKWMDSSSLQDKVWKLLFDFHQSYFFPSGFVSLLFQSGILHSSYWRRFQDSSCNWWTHCSWTPWWPQVSLFQIFVLFDFWFSFLTIFIGAIVIITFRIAALPMLKTILSWLRIFPNPLVNYEKIYFDLVVSLKTNFSFSRSSLSSDKLQLHSSNLTGTRGLRRFNVFLL